MCSKQFKLYRKVKFLFSLLLLYVFKNFLLKIYKNTFPFPSIYDTTYVSYRWYHAFYCSLPFSQNIFWISLVFNLMLTFILCKTQCNLFDRAFTLLISEAFFGVPLFLTFLFTFWLSRQSVSPVFKCKITF